MTVTTTANLRPAIPHLSHLPFHRIKYTKYTPVQKILHGTSLPHHTRTPPHVHSTVQSQSNTPPSRFTTARPSSESTRARLCTK
jgi:hypothetical protein